MKDRNDYILYFRRVPTYEDFQNNFDKYLKTGDDLYLNNACFACQQALEYLLKGILQYFDIDFCQSGKDGHNIKNLLNLILDNTPINFESKDKLLKLSDTISKWETQGRYTLGIKIKMDTLRNIKNIYKEIEDNFSEYRFYNEKE